MGGPARASSDMRQILSASAGVRPSQTATESQARYSGMFLLLELFSLVANGNRAVHGGKANRGWGAAVLNAAIVIVPGLAGIVANACLAAHRRVVPRFHHKAGLVAVRHHQGQRAILRVGR